MYYEFFRDAVGRKKLGDQAKAEKRYEDALGYYTEAIQLDETYADAYAARCLVHIELRHYGRAHEDNDSAAHYNRAYRRTQSHIYCKINFLSGQQELLREVSTTKSFINK